MSGLIAEKLARLRRRARRQELEAAAMQREILQREAGAGVDALVVVDDRHLPAAARTALERGLVLEQRYEIGLFGHQALRSDHRFRCNVVFPAKSKPPAG